MMTVTDFSGLSRDELTACIRYGRARLPALREKMILRKLKSTPFYDLKVEYVQLKKLTGLMQFWRGWAHDLPAYHAVHADDMPALRKFLNTPARPSLAEHLKALGLR